jgi:hypothetical protein
MFILPHVKAFLKYKKPIFRKTAKVGFSSKKQVRIRVRFSWRFRHPPPLSPASGVSGYTFCSPLDPLLSRSPSVPKLANRVVATAVLSDSAPFL